MPCAAGSARPRVPARPREASNAPGEEFQPRKLGCAFQPNSERPREELGGTVFGFFS